MPTANPLQDRTFRRLFTAQVVALAGTGLLTVALGLLAYDLAGARAGAVLGTALAIKMVAYVLVAPVTAAVTARVPPKTLLIATDVVRAAIALGLPFVDAVWQIYLLIFLLQAASATFTPAFQTLVAAILTGDAGYTRALSLSRLAYDLESLASPVLAAALLAVLPYPALFVGTVAGFLSSAASILSTRPTVELRSEQSQRFWDRALRGARVMWRTTELRALLALDLVVAAATGLVMVNTVVYVRDLFNAQANGLAVALACYGAGSMAAALGVPRILTITSDRTVMLTGAVAASAGLTATTVFLLISPSGVAGWAALATLWATMGAATSLVNTPAARVLRRNCSADDRTPVFTAQFSLSHAGFLLTYPIAGWVGAALHQAVAALSLATLATLATSAAFLAWPRRGKERYGTATRDTVAAPGEPGSRGCARPGAAGRGQRNVPHAGRPDPAAPAVAAGPGRGRRHRAGRRDRRIAHLDQPAPGETAVRPHGGHP